MAANDKKDLLKQNRILVVDDEPDVLEHLREVLSNFCVDTASSFEVTSELLENNQYDVAVLDIMGVRGYDLLNKCVRKKIPAIMLTSKAVSQEDLLRSLREGAVLFLSKEYMNSLETYISELIQAKREQKSPFKRWMDTLDDFFKKLLGVDYRKEHRDIFDKLLSQ
ncbi:MAG: response regulator [Desulfatiglandales bacterium]